MRETSANCVRTVVGCSLEALIVEQICRILGREELSKITEQTLRITKSPRHPLIYAWNDRESSKERASSDLRLTA